MKSRLKLPLGWRSSQLDEVADVILSNVDKKSYDDQIPVRLCNYTDVYYNDKIINGLDFMEATATDREVERFRIHPGDVLITKDSETPDDIAVPALVEDEFDDVLCGYHLAILRPDSTAVSGAYLSFLLGLHWVRHYFFTLANGVTRYGLTSDAIRKAVLPFPPLPEQKKIAEILTTWDDAIATVSKLIESKRALKKGLMQQLLTGKRRFPEFVKSNRFKETPLGSVPEDWSVVQISDLFKPVRRKNEKGVTRVLTASGQHGLVDQREFFNRSVAGANLEGYYLLKRGEFAYNRSLMNGYPFGATKRMERYDEGALSTLYLCFALEGRKSDSDFYTHLFEAGVINRQLRQIAQVGARAHGLLNVTAGDFYSIAIPKPDLAEQKQIASVLNGITDEIEVLVKVHDRISHEKCGLMQKLLTGQVRVKVDEEVSG